VVESGRSGRARPDQAGFPGSPANFFSRAQVTGPLRRNHRLLTPHPPGSHYLLSPRGLVGTTTPLQNQLDLSSEGPAAVEAGHVGRQRKRDVVVKEDDARPIGSVVAGLAGPSSLVLCRGFCRTVRGMAMPVTDEARFELPC
jgi:hypothetical protein